MEQGQNYNYQQNNWNQQQFNQSNVNNKRNSDTMAIISLIIGILSLIGCCCFGGVAGVIGVILSIIALNDVYCNRKTMATIALILNIIGLLLTIGFTIIGLSNPEGTYNYETFLENSIEESGEEKEENITYEYIDLQTAFDELNNNALRAETKYQNKYVVLTGYLNGIDSDGEYISIQATSDEWEFDYAMCYLRTDEQKAVVVNLNEGDKITIKGQITTIGEVIGYGVDVHSIEKVQE